jgi:hypothetical protein
MIQSTPNFIIQLSREIKVYSDGSGDLDGLSVDALKTIVIALKTRELKYEISKNEAILFIEELSEEISDLPFKDDRDKVMIKRIDKFFKG